MLGAECHPHFLLIVLYISINYHLMGKSEKLSFGFISYIFQFYVSLDVSFQGYIIIVVVCKYALFREDKIVLLVHNTVKIHKF